MSCFGFPIVCFSCRMKQSMTFPPCSQRFGECASAKSTCCNGPQPRRLNAAKAVFLRIRAQCSRRLCCRLCAYSPRLFWVRRQEYSGCLLRLPPMTYLARPSNKGDYPPMTEPIFCSVPRVCGAFLTPSARRQTTFFRRITGRSSPTSVLPTAAPRPISVCAF